MTTFNVDEIKLAILKNATNEDLNEILEAIKMRRQRLTKLNVRKINIGDKVKFTGRQGVEITGDVTSVKIKNVIVKTPTGNWRVPANMLTIV